MQVRAIATKYDGYRFRSRTEARWAVFFNTIGFKYQYEDEGYALSTGRRYLPDFKLRLPNDKTYYAEVKHSEFDDLGDDEILNLRQFSREVNERILILPGTPEFRSYNLILPDHPPNTFCAALFKDYDPYVQIVDEYWLQYLEHDETNGRMMLNTKVEDDICDSFGKKFYEAIVEARSARFEHGESPK